MSKYCIRRCCIRFAISLLLQSFSYKTASASKLLLFSRICFKVFYRGSVAHVVRCWTCEQHVAGSTPDRRIAGQRPWASRSRACTQRSEVTTVWRYRNLINLIFTVQHLDKRRLLNDDVEDDEDDDAIMKYFTSLNVLRESLLILSAGRPVHFPPLPHRGTNRQRRDTIRR